MTAQVPLIESPIERQLFESVGPFVRLDVALAPQVEVETKRGKRRVDFLLTDNKTFVVLECDGAAFHNFDSDLRRDIDLFAAGAHAIFHFSGSFIHRYPRHLAPTIAYFVPDFFTQQPDLQAACPLPCDGAYVRIAPTFPGIRPEIAERVVDDWSLRTLDSCRMLHMQHINPEFTRAAIAQWNAEAGVDPKANQAAEFLKRLEEHKKTGGSQQ